jgi:uncharacterized DUF497 family protein
MTIYEFDWDPATAASNHRKHGVAFEDAMVIFEDPLLLTIFDPDHSDTEERWIYIGLTRNGQLILAVHTYAEAEDANTAIRIISARRPTKNETRQYQQGT